MHVTIEDPPYSFDGPPLWIANRALNENEASIPVWPKLQMARTGLVTACENVIVSTFALPPKS